MNYDNTNKGVLFKEKGPKKEDWHDDYSGTINVEGVEYFIGASVRKSKENVPYMKLSVRKKEIKAKDTKPSYKKPEPDTSFEDEDLPF